MTNIEADLSFGYSGLHRRWRRNHLQEHDRTAATPRVSPIPRRRLWPAAPGEIVRRAAGLPRGFSVLLRQRLEGGLLAAIFHELRNPPRGNSVETATIPFLSSGGQIAVATHLIHGVERGQPG